MKTARNTDIFGVFASFSVQNTHFYLRRICQLQRTKHPYFRNICQLQCRTGRFVSSELLPALVYKTPIYIFGVFAGFSVQNTHNFGVFASFSIQNTHLYHGPIFTLVYVYIFRVSPSLTSFVVSVDVKHHVYLFRSICQLQRTKHPFISSEQLPALAYKPTDSQTAATEDTRLNCAATDCDRVWFHPLHTPLAEESSSTFAPAPCTTDSGAPDSLSKGLGSCPGRSSGRIEFFLRQSQLSVLTLILISVPLTCYRSSTYKSQSFYQKCRWQLTAKRKYTLRFSVFQ